MLDTLDLEQVTASILKELEFAKRPVLIFGYGVKLAGAQEVARSITETLNIPVCPTWGAIDVFPGCVGSFGTHGVRAANFAVQNADYILSVGSRLDTKATGTPASSFAPKAKLVMVDIDPDELDKMAKIGRLPWRAIRADAKEFLNMLSFWMRTKSSHDLNAGTFRNPDWDAWRLKVEGWKEKYPPGVQCKGINPYGVMRALGKHLNKTDTIVTDTGLSLGWLMQAYPFKGEEFVHALNMTPMGYGLPAASGAAWARDRVICITGDGGLNVNITEFATIFKHEQNVKVIVFNNRAHGMCQQTERQWLNGKYCGTSDKDIATPDFVAIARSYGISAEGFDDDLYRTRLAEFLCLPGPALMELRIRAEVGLSPQARFGFPIHDQDPVLDREEIDSVMREAA